MSLGFSGRTRPHARFTNLPGGTGTSTVFASNTNTVAAARGRTRSSSRDEEGGTTGGAREEPSVTSVKNLLDKQQAKRVLDLVNKRKGEAEARGDGGSGRRGARRAVDDTSPLERRPASSAPSTQERGDEQHGLYARVAESGARVYVVYPMWQTKEGKVQMRQKTVDPITGQLAYVAIDAYDSVTGERFLSDFSLLP